MESTLLLCIIAVCAIGVRAPPGDDGPGSHHGHSLMCLHCDSVDNPSHCHHHARCHPDEYCGTVVRQASDGTRRTQLTCLRHDECSPDLHLIGRRALHYNHRVCTECCHSATDCNRHLCSRYFSSVSPTHQPPAPSHRRMECYDCQNVDDPLACTHKKLCSDTQSCGTMVESINHKMTFTLQCINTAECSNSLSFIFGLRYYCHQCCNNHDGCNLDLCGQYVNHHIARPTTTLKPSITAATTTRAVASATTPTTVIPTTAIHLGQDPNCRDRDEDGFSCASFDLFNFCQDSSAFSMALVKAKCPHYCGLCIPGPGYSSTVQISHVDRPPSGLCVDYEQDGILCADYDQFNVCQDPSSIEYVFAHEKCRKHCGHCQITHPAVTKGVPTTTVYVPTSTVAPTTTTVPTTPTTQAPCVDIEEGGFRCIDYDTMDFCNDVSSATYILATKLCRKHCGFCNTDAAHVHTTILHVPTHPVPAATSPLPCVDYEHANFKCADYDSLNFCKDTSSIAHVIATQTCRKHCGFCSPI